MKKLQDIEDESLPYIIGVGSAGAVSNGSISKPKTIKINGFIRPKDKGTKGRRGKPANPGGGRPRT